MALCQSLAGDRRIGSPSFWHRKILRVLSHDNRNDRHQILPHGREKADLLRLKNACMMTFWGSPMGFTKRSITAHNQLLQLPALA